MKRIISLLLTMVMLFSMVSIPSLAAGEMYTVEADKATAVTGETINFTVYLNDCSAVDGGVRNYEFSLLIPEGLTFVANSGVYDTAFATTTQFMMPSFNPANYKASSMGILGTGGYTGGKIAIMTFSCTVNDGATGELGVSLLNPKYTVGTTTVSAAVVPATVTVNPAHEHTFSTEWSKDDTYHWHAADCEHTTEVADKAEHVYDKEVVDEQYKITDADCVTGAKYFKSCICGAKPATETADNVFYTQTLATHNYGELIPAVEEKHTQSELVASVEAHYECSVCHKLFVLEGETYVEKTIYELTGKTPVHNADKWKFDDEQHWKICSVCDYVAENVVKSNHTFDNITDTTCNDECGYTRGAHIHTYSDKWSYDGENHWHEATCGCENEVSGLEHHNGGAATCTSKAVCTVCEQPYGDYDATNHANYDTYLDGASQPDHKNQVNGYTGDKRCNSCKQIVEQGTTIPVAPHAQADGWEFDSENHWKVCSVEGCDYVFENTKDKHTESEWKLSGSKHYKECTECGYDIYPEEEHEDEDKNGLCDKCQTVVAYIVTFDENGGSEVEDQYVPVGEMAEKPEDPTKEGHNFIAWLLDGEVFNFFSTVLTGNITLVAQWEEIQPEVPATTSVTVTKEWDVPETFDLANLPESVEVYLLANGQEVTDSRTVLDAGNQWTYTWEELPVATEDGAEIEYSVAEVVVEGYETSIEANATVANGFVITNTLIEKEPEVPETTTVTVTKEWAAPEGTVLPEAIEVYLLANGQQVGDSTVRLTAEEDWTYTFENLPVATEDGADIVYTVDEVNVDGFEKVIGDAIETDTGIEIAITNTLIEEEPEVPVEPSVSLDPTAITIVVGETAELTAIVTPEDLADYALSWSSSDETVATVNLGEVSALKVGTTTITVTLMPNMSPRNTDGYPTATCLVTVIEKEEELPETHKHTPEVIPGCAPTCTMVGYTDGSKCKDCGTILVEQQIIPKLPHERGMTVVENVRLATPYYPGSYDFVGYCVNCNTELDRRTIIVPYIRPEIPSIPETPEVTPDVEPEAPHIHTYEDVKGFESTCTENGLTNGVICGECGETIVAQKIVPAKGHTYSPFVVENLIEATATENGSYELVSDCSVCGEELARIKVDIPATGGVENPDTADEETSVNAFVLSSVIVVVISLAAVAAKKFVKVK